MTAARTAERAFCRPPRRFYRAPNPGESWALARAGSVASALSLCEGGDLNRHGSYPASTSSWCVCQFRHLRVGCNAVPLEVVGFRGRECIAHGPGGMQARNGTPRPNRLPRRGRQDGRPANPSTPDNRRLDGRTPRSRSAGGGLEVAAGGHEAAHGGDDLAHLEGLAHPGVDEVLDAGGHAARDAAD